MEGENTSLIMSCLGNANIKTIKQYFSKLQQRKIVLVDSIVVP